MDPLTARLEQGIAARGAALMGIVNATPDSFYDGGRYAVAADARSRVDSLLAEGADIIDIGGESTRPGALPVPADEQIARIEPVVSHALERGAVVSIDTRHPSVADHMLSRGAHLVNDVSCLADPELAGVCANYGATLLLMHVRGDMSQMRGFSVFPDDAYTDVVQSVLAEWRSSRDRAVERGMRRERVWFDPGLGFAKNARQSFALLRGLACFQDEGVPIAVGPSRKSFIKLAQDAPPEARLGGTIAACLLAVERGATVLRVHDVRDVAQALLVARAIRDPAPEGVADA